MFEQLTVAQVYKVNGYLVYHTSNNDDLNVAPNIPYKVLILKE